MSIPLHAIKVVFSGKLPGSEHWSTSFWVAGQVAHDVVELTNLAHDVDQMAQAGGAFYPELKNICGTQVTVDQIDVYQYEGGTKAAVQATQAASWTASTASITLPNQVCAVASLRTGLPGRARRGRMYLPVLGTVSSASGQCTDGNLNLLSQGLATFFGSFNTLAWGKVSVMSASTSDLYQVTEVQIDSVLDTQRRRRDKLVPINRNIHAVAA